jgi:endonuclease YncB( thermonuclease family)
MTLLERRVAAILLGAGALAGAVSAAPAQVAAPAACTGPGAPGGEVTSITDGRSFRLADGREIRLAAIETPSLAGDEAAGLAARDALAALVLYHTVTLAAAAPDRYGRLVAYVAVPEEGDARSVQRAMLAGGNALLSPIGVAPGCRSLLRTAEQAARAARLGLWGQSDYGVRRADDPADVLAYQGHFAVVGGKVASVRESGGIVYVNFGRIGSDRFTATIGKRNERLFASAGLVPAKLAGRRVEVRGWIEERNGPVIAVARPEQIELID